MKEDRRQIYPFLDPRIENYCEQMLSAEKLELTALDRQTHLRFVRPNMISGHWQGEFLQILSKMQRPKTILEIGTFSGYSTLCLASGLQKGGVLHTIEKDGELNEFLLAQFKQNGYENQIILHIGQAIEIINTIPETFDLIFIDADKASYPDYYNICIEKLNSGGVILADNILWYGKVGLDPMPEDKETIAINSFNKLISADQRVENCILPIRDGIMIGRKR
jgi:Predicted O-methyltransferase